MNLDVSGTVMRLFLCGVSQIHDTTISASKRQIAPWFRIRCSRYANKCEGGAQTERLLIARPSKDLVREKKDAIINA